MEYKILSRRSSMGMMMFLSGVLVIPMVSGVKQPRILTGIKSGIKSFSENSFR